MEQLPINDNNLCHRTDEEEELINFNVRQRQNRIIQAVGWDGQGPLNCSRICKLTFSAAQVVS